MSKLTGDQTEPWASLIAAIASGQQEDLNRVIEILEEAPTLARDADELGNTPLHLAVNAKNANSCNIIITLKLAHAAEVDCTNKAGNTPLHLAVSNSQIEVVTTLISSCNAKKDILNKDGNTALHIAAIDNNVAMINLLVELGVNIESKSAVESTPLHSAVNAQKVDAVKALVSLGANKYAKNAASLTPEDFINFIDPGLNGVIMRIKAAFNTKSAHTSSAAASSSPAPIEVSGLEKTYEASQVISVNTLFSLLLTAIRKNDIQQTQNLLRDTPCLAFYATEKGITALHSAANLNNINAITLLIEAGTDTEVKAGSRATPLHWATLANNHESITRLVELKADINTKTDAGRTALHIAVNRGDIRTVSTLASLGADKYIRDNAGKTPADVLSEAEPNDALMEAFYTEPKTQSSSTAAASSSPALIETKGSKKAYRISDLISRDILLEFNRWIMSNTSNQDIILNLKSLPGLALYKNHHGDTSLHLAACNNNAGAISLLIEAKADIEARNIKNNTAMDVAVQHNSYEAIAKLIELKADVNAMDNLGNTPSTILAIALEANTVPQTSQRPTAWRDLLVAITSADVEKIEQTVKSNPDLVRFKEDDGSTALHFASCKTNHEIAVTLVKFRANINAKDDNGNTPLCSAMKFKNVGVVSALVSLGANKVLANNYGETPVDLLNTMVMAGDEADKLMIALCTDPEVQGFAAAASSMPESDLAASEADFTALDNRSEPINHLFEGFAHSLAASIYFDPETIQKWFSRVQEDGIRPLSPFIPTLLAAFPRLEHKITELQQLAQNFGLADELDKLNREPEKFINKLKEACTRLKADTATGKIEYEPDSECKQAQFDEMPPELLDSYRPREHKALHNAAVVHNPNYENDDFGYADDKAEAKPDVLLVEQDADLDLAAALALSLVGQGADCDALE